MMAKRRMMLRQRQQGTGGGLLTFAVMLMTVSACVLVSPPKLEDVAAVFSHRTVKSAANDAAVSLPAKNWFLVISDSKAVAACQTLIEAEIICDSYGELASLQAVETSAIAMQITASNEQLSALRQGADAMMEVFSDLDRMAHLNAEDAASLAALNTENLSKLCRTMDAALSGTQNAVVRGLSGLIASCREAMSNLSANPTMPRIQHQYASLVQQYASYTDFLMSMA